MAQAFIDQMTMETIGGATNDYTQAKVSLVVMEVLGYFKFGTVDIDELVTEVLGAAPNYSLINIDMVVVECIGQWAGF